MNVARLLTDSIEQFGEFPAVNFEGRWYTNVERLLWAEKLASVLGAHGACPGDRVLVMMPNSPDVTATFHAVWRLGAVIVPVTPHLTASEVRYLLESSGVSIAITCPVLQTRLTEASAGIASFRELLTIGGDGPNNIAQEVAAAEPIRSTYATADDDLALLLYTSGTTGNPKGVMLTHRNLDANARATAEVVRPPPQTMHAHILPLSHSFGVLCMNMDALQGCRSVILPRFDCHQFFEAIQEFQVKRFAAVPTVLNYMLLYPDRDKFDCSSLEYVSSGGAALPEEIRRHFEEEFHCKVLRGYGLSEAAPTVSALGEVDWPRPGSVGKPLPGVDVLITDDVGRPVPPGTHGEICVRGANVMKGYWNDPEATRAVMRDGWLRTGDIGRLDADGYLYITDRLKDIIIKGGENISPRQIEEVMMQHPAVAEVAVIGVPSDAFGEDVGAVVVLRPGHDATESELRAFTSHHIARFKVPVRVFIRGSLPKNSLGKVLKRELKRDYSGG